MGNKDLIAVIDRAAKEVAKWPKWKRDCARQINYSLYKSKTLPKK